MTMLRSAGDLAIGDMDRLTRLRQNPVS